MAPQTQDPGGASTDPTRGALLSAMIRRYCVATYIIVAERVGP